MNQAHNHLYAVDTLTLSDHEITTLLFIGTDDNEVLDHCDLPTIANLLDLHLIQCDNHNPLAFSLTLLGRHYLPATAQQQAE